VQQARVPASGVPHAASARAPQGCPAEMDSPTEGIALVRRSDTDPDMQHAYDTHQRTSHAVAHIRTWAASAPALAQRTCARQPAARQHLNAALS
jgi:hypothetical protein